MQKKNVILMIINDIRVNVDLKNGILRIIEAWQIDGSILTAVTICILKMIEWLCDIIGRNYLIKPRLRG